VGSRNNSSLSDRMALSSEQIAFIVALAATLILPLWMKYRSSLLGKVEEVLDDVEDLIEEKTGIDVELSEVVEEVMEKVADSATEALEDVAEDGVLDSKDELVDEIKEAVDEAIDDVSEKLKAMTVNELKNLLKEQGMPISGKKAELIERLLEAGVDLNRNH